jgi:hypothetical protein
MKKVLFCSLIVFFSCGKEKILPRNIDKIDDKFALSKRILVNLFILDSGECAVTINGHNINKDDVEGRITGLTTSNSIPCVFKQESKGLIFKFPFQFERNKSYNFSLKTSIWGDLNYQFQISTASEIITFLKTAGPNNYELWAQSTFNQPCMAIFNTFLNTGKKNYQQNSGRIGYTGVRIDYDEYPNILRNFTQQNNQIDNPDQLFFPTNQLIHYKKSINSNQSDLIVSDCFNFNIERQLELEVFVLSSEDWEYMENLYKNHIYADNIFYIPSEVKTDYSENGQIQFKKTQITKINQTVELNDPSDIICTFDVQENNVSIISSPTKTLRFYFYLKTNNGNGQQIKANLRINQISGKLEITKNEILTSLNRCSSDNINENEINCTLEVFDKQTNKLLKRTSTSFKSHDKNQTHNFNL